MRAYRHHLQYEFMAGLRNRILLFMNYGLPLGFYLMMGLIITKLNPMFAPTMVPAMTLFAIMSASLLALPNTLVTSREAGVFRTYRINGVPVLSVLTIPVVAVLVQTAVVAALIALTAPSFFGAALPGNWLAFGLVTVVATFAIAALGVLIGVVSSSAPATIVWSQLIYVTSMLIGGLMAPIETMPSELARVANLLPATHAMYAYRGLAGMGGDAAAGWRGFAFLVVGGVIALLLALHLYSWDPRNAERRAPAPLAFLALLPYIAATLFWR